MISTPHGQKDIPRALLMAILIYTLIFIAYTFINHYTFGTQAYDTGIYIQSLWTTANDEGFFYNTPEAQGLGWELPSKSHFGVHFQPILLLLVPLYKVFPHAELLFFVHTLALALAAIPLYKLAYAVLDDKKMSLIVAVGYLINPAIHGINRYDFHPVSLVVPFIFLTMLYWERKDYKKAFLVAGFVLLAKEDAGLVLISIGLFYILLNLKWANLTKPHKLVQTYIKEINLILLGALWIVLSIFIVIPYFGGHGYSFGFYTLKVHYPQLAKQLIFIHLASVVFLPVLCPQLFLATLPLWAELVLSPAYGMLKIGYHYPYMLTPMLFLISIYSLRTYKIPWRYVASIMIMSFLLFSPLVNLSKSPDVAGVSFSALIKRAETNWELYKALHEELKEYSSFDGKLVVQDNVFPHLANNPNVYLLREHNIDDAQLILVCPAFRDLYTRYYIPLILNMSNVINICPGFIDS